MVEPSWALLRPPSGATSDRSTASPTRLAAPPSIAHASRVVPSVVIPRGGPWWRKLLAFAGPGSWSRSATWTPATGRRTSRVCAVRVHPAQRDPDLEPDGEVAQGAGRQAWRRHRSDLAQACRDHYSRPVSFVSGYSADRRLPRRPRRGVIGSAIALNLLFGIPLLYGVLINAADVLLVRPLQARDSLPRGLRHRDDRRDRCSSPSRWCCHAGDRTAVKGLVRPLNCHQPADALHRPRDSWCHGHAAQPLPALGHRTGTLHRQRGHRQARDHPMGNGRFPTLALFFAFLINAAILILSAATFHGTGYESVADIHDADALLTPLLGSYLRWALRGALLASGQNSTITGALAGQIVMEGYLDIRLPTWLRRLIARLIAPSSGGDRDRDVWRAGDRLAPDPESGDPVAAALVRRDPAGAVHSSKPKMGEVREPTTITKFFALWWPWSSPCSMSGCWCRRQRRGFG